MMGVSSHRLGDYLESRREKGEEGLPTLSVTLNRGLVRRESLDRKTDTNLKASQHIKVMPGDIAYNMMRMWQGASGLADEEAIVSPAYVVLSPKDNIDPRYAASLFKTPRMIHLFWAYSYGLTNDRLRLYPKDIKRVPIDIPPLPEQRKIAEILSTWDRAIEVSEALLATARTQKRALMQALLTGKRRFPAFAGQDWKEVRLGDVCSTWSGGTPSRQKPEYYQGTIPWIKSGEVNATRVETTGEHITHEALQTSSAKMVEPETILIAMYGATAGVVSVSGIHAAINQAILAVQTNELVCSNYLFFAIQLKMEETKRITQGGQPNLNAQIIKRAKFLLPSIPEQKRIAKILEAAQNEISILADHIHHLRTEKRALMQQLLTGKRRVVV